jgi:hypothetical protein
MAKYRLTAPAIIDDAQREVGFEFETDAVPGPHMEPLDDAAKKAVAERDKAAKPEIALDQNVMKAYPEEETRPSVEPAHRAEPPHRTEPPHRAEDKKDDDRAGPGGHRRG